LIDCDGRLANAIRTGVTVLDFRHVAHHSQLKNKRESNICDTPVMWNLNAWSENISSHNKSKLT